MQSEKDFLIQIDSWNEAEEEEESDLIEIKLPSKTIKISYSRLCKYSSLIRTKYLFSDVKNKITQIIQTFQKQYNINDENVSFFFQIIQGEQIPITKEKYRDFFKLSEFLQVKKLQRILKKFSETQLNDLDLMIQLILNEIETAEKADPDDYKYDLTVQMERYLTNHIEDCLKNENLKKLPVSIIYQILEKSDKEKIPNDLLFDFVNQSIDQYFVLLYFLDIGKLSDSKFQEFYDCYMKYKDDSKKCYFELIPRSLPFIMDLKNENEKTKIQIIQINQEKDHLNKINAKISLFSFYLISFSIFI